MSHLTLKLAAAVVVALFSAQAAPALERRLHGSDCHQSASSGNVDISSTTSIAPVTEVTPITRYQPYVQTFAPIVDSECDFADYGRYGGYRGYGGYEGYGAYGRGYRGAYGRRAGSHVNIQPTTHVKPDTTYQPTVNQLTTSIDAAPQQDQSLPQSSVQLGSSVHIAPEVHVQPLTTFQSSVKSLPFIINAEPCVPSFSADRVAYAAAGARSSASAIAASSAGAASLSMARSQGQIRTQSMA
ncbi:hypothetical protein BGZ68_008401 [Mortierella alpina]|nr:hypothetical protein BGZ68_008401 [Mortierella alpina]